MCHEESPIGEIYFICNASTTSSKLSLFVVFVEIENIKNR
jgi:hypothetical protein